MTGAKEKRSFPPKTQWAQYERAPVRIKVTRGLSLAACALVTEKRARDACTRLRNYSESDIRASILKKSVPWGKVDPDKQSCLCHEFSKFENKEKLPLQIYTAPTKKKKKSAVENKRPARAASLPRVVRSVSLSCFVRRTNTTSNHPRCPVRADSATQLEILSRADREPPFFFPPRISPRPRPSVCWV
jgi:hypothetical protein